MNIPLLRQIQRHITEEPLRLSMQNWLIKDINWLPLKPKCGTVGCIAGWAVTLSGERAEQGEVARVAARLLELDFKDSSGCGIDEDCFAAQVFLPAQWPRPFAGEYESLDLDIEDAIDDGDEERYRELRAREAALVCRRIDHLIATGE